MRITITTLLLAALAAAPGRASDPLSSLRFLVGTWNCTYEAGKARINYKATFSYDLNGNWMRESDSWEGGGGDLAMFTYEKNGWTSVVMEHERTSALFRASGKNPNHVVYRSVYPQTGLTDVFDRVSPTRFTVHFKQTSRGKTMSSIDVCDKA
jgi:hypothetical protein